MAARSVSASGVRTILRLDGILDRLSVAGVFAGLVLDLLEALRGQVDQVPAPLLLFADGEFGPHPAEAAFPLVQEADGRLEHRVGAGVAAAFDVVADQGFELGGQGDGQRRSSSDATE